MRSDAIISYNGLVSVEAWLRSLLL